MTNDIGLVIDRAIAPVVRRLRAQLAVVRQHAAAPSKALHRPQKRKDRLVNARSLSLAGSSPPKMGTFRSISAS